jgi:hypothetical protein
MFKHESKLYRCAIDIYIARVYLFQLLRSETWVAEYLPLIESPIESLSLLDIKELFDKTEYTDLPNEVYFFSNTNNIPLDNTLALDKFPKLFTGIKECSLDGDGLLVLSSFQIQHYDLYNSFGKLIYENCHDLNLVYSNKFLARSLPNVESYGFNLYEIITHTDEFHLNLIHKYDDIGIRINEVFQVSQRDTFFLKEIHSNLHQVVIIPKISDSSYQRIFNERNIEEAISCLRESPLLYTLYPNSIRENIVVLKTIFNCHVNLNGFVTMFNVQLENILSKLEILELIKTKKLNLLFLKNRVQIDNDILEIAAKNDDYFLEYVNEIAPQLFSNRNLMELVSQNTIVFNETSHLDHDNNQDLPF